MSRRNKNRWEPYKSGIEFRTAKELGTKALYEPDDIPFVQPEKQRKYKPDFKVAENVYIECKGRWTAEDRQKHLWVKEQHPEIKIYILFEKSDNTISKRSKTTYGDFATKIGLEWADERNGIPKHWMQVENKKTNRTTGRNSRVPGGTNKRGGSILARIFSDKSDK